MYSNTDTFSQNKSNFEKFCIQWQPNSIPKSSQKKTEKKPILLNIVYIYTNKWLILSIDMNIFIQPETEPISNKINSFVLCIKKKLWI